MAAAQGWEAWGEPCRARQCMRWAVRRACWRGDLKGSGDPWPVCSQSTCRYGEASARVQSVSMQAAAPQFQGAEESLQGGVSDHPGEMQAAAADTPRSGGAWVYSCVVSTVKPYHTSCCL